MEFLQRFILLYLIMQSFLTIRFSLLRICCGITFWKNLNKIPNDYNGKSGLPYEVACSCGHFTLFSKEFSSFEEMQRIADSHLYEVKAKHRRRRNEDGSLKSMVKA